MASLLSTAGAKEGGTTMRCTRVAQAAQICAATGRAGTDAQRWKHWLRLCTQVALPTPQLGICLGSRLSQANPEAFQHCSPCLAATVREGKVPPMPKYVQMPMKCALNNPIGNTTKISLRWLKALHPVHFPNEIFHREKQLAGQRVCKAAVAGGSCAALGMCFILHLLQDMKQESPRHPPQMQVCPA